MADQPLRPLSLRFRAQDVVLDGELQRAVPPEAQQLWRDLQLQGTLDELEVDLHHSAAAVQPLVEVRAKQIEQSGSLSNPAGLQIRPVWFPYRVSNLRGQVQSPEQKKELLRQYIARELLYDSAKRMGLDRDQEVIEGIFQAKKALMTEKLLEQEIEKEVDLDNYTNADVETYFKANQEKYAEKDESGNVKRLKPFSEVARQVAQDFIGENFMLHLRKTD